LIGLTDKCDAHRRRIVVIEFGIWRCGIVSAMDLMRALTGEVSISRHVQSGSKGNHFNINFSPTSLVMLSHVAHVIEDEIS